MKSDKTVPIRRLPLMANFDDADALYEREQDPFYLAAFMIQCWLGGLLLHAAARYAENKNPKDRALQSGESWRSFGEMFGANPDKDHSYLLSCLLRFSASDDSPGNSLRRALVPLAIEHRTTGDYLGPKTMNQLQARTAAHPPNSRQGPKVESPPPLNPQPTTRNPLLARRTIVRWCDWLDAEIHLRTHRRWHESPACFDPDPETRTLAALGHGQRHLARLDPRAQVAWVCDFANAAARYKDSPKWPSLGKAMADNSTRQWQYPEVDTLAIALWPLVKAFNWTYRDLLNVIRPALTRPKAYPCGRDQDFAAYTSNVLGLRKTGKGLSATNGRPKGYDIAIQFCPALAGHKNPPN